MTLSPPRRAALPDRWPRLGAVRFTLVVIVLAIIVAALTDVAPSPERLVDGAPRLMRLLERMMPPDLDPAFLQRMGARLVETLQIAIAGTVVGIVISFPLAWFAARGVGPSRLLRWPARALVSLFRTVPDLVWALVFVSAVGLGAVAGTMAIVVDTIGFCGRFFAEAMEDADKKPQEALDAIGARKVDILFAAIVPAAMPSFINTSLFSLERAVRSSVVLGIVGAGGIGQELKAAFELFQYQKASTIIIAIFLIVLAMEELTDWLRRKVA